MQMSRRLPLAGAHLSAHLQRLVEPQGLDLTAPYLADALKAACMRVVESRAEARAVLDSVRRASAAPAPAAVPSGVAAAAPLAVPLQLPQCLWGGWPLPVAAVVRLAVYQSAPSPPVAL